MTQNNCGRNFPATEYYCVYNPSYYRKTLQGKHPSYTVAHGRYHARFTSTSQKKSYRNNSNFHTLDFINSESFILNYLFFNW